MGNRQWPTQCFQYRHFNKCFVVITATLLLTIGSICFPGAVFAQERQESQENQISQNHDQPLKTVFDGTYVIYLSEKTRFGASGRPEPGYFDRLAIELFAKAGLKTQIVPHKPWKRQMGMAEREVGHVIYPTTRVENREDRFKWVGPISRTIWNLYGFTDQGWDNMAFSTLLRDARIGVLSGSARESYLKLRGAEQLVAVPREELLFPMMMAGRVDLVAVGRNILNYYIDQAEQGYSAEDIPDISGVFPYRICYLYIAISGDVPENDVAKLQTQLDRLKTNGFFVENRRMHGLSTNLESSFLKAMLDLDNNGTSCTDLSGKDE